jgi:[ribosomal protein S5]-alanine N-acetyltransferase
MPRLQTAGQCEAPCAADAGATVSTIANAGSMKVLVTDGLRLEPQVAAHATEMFNVLSDPAIYEFENQAPVSLDALRTRFARLESRKSPDGAAHWLNWVIRLPSSSLAGYVQATVSPTREALIAYELASAYWHLGVGSRAVSAVLISLANDYGVTRAYAVFKRANHRSRRLLVRQGFQPAGATERARLCVEVAEDLMSKRLT